MDAQTRCDDTAALVALAQCLVKLEAEEGYAAEAAIAAQEVIAENRFIAARDGVDAELVDVEPERRVPVAEMIADLLDAACPTPRSWAARPSCSRSPKLLEDPPARRQIAAAKNTPSLGHVDRPRRRLADQGVSPTVSCAAATRARLQQAAEEPLRLRLGSAPQHLLGRADLDQPALVQEADACRRPRGRSPSRGWR